MPLQMFVNPNLAAELTYQGARDLGSGIGQGLNSLGAGAGAYLDKQKKESQEASALRKYMEHRGIDKDQLNKMSLGELRGQEKMLNYQQQDELQQAHLAQTYGALQHYAAQNENLKAQNEMLKAHAGYYQTQAEGGSKSELPFGEALPVYDKEGKLLGHNIGQGAGRAPHFQTAPDSLADAFSSLDPKANPWLYEPNFAKFQEGYKNAPEDVRKKAAPIYRARMDPTMQKIIGAMMGQQMGGAGGGEAAPPKPPGAFMTEDEARKSGKKKGDTFMLYDPDRNGYYKYRLN